MAIAITLLALDLRLDKKVLSGVLSFRDIGNLWTKFSAFFLSFILIAVFWKVHHEFYGFIYSLNTLMITVFQNLIWDYVAVRPDYLNEKATPDLIYIYRFNCNVAMINALIAITVSFFSPLIAFLILFTRPFMMRGLLKAFRRKTKSG